VAPAIVEAFAAAAITVELAALGPILEQTLQSEDLVAADGVDRVLALNDVVVLLAAVVRTAIGGSTFRPLPAAQELKKELASIFSVLKKKFSVLEQAVASAHALSSSPTAFAGFRGLLSNVAEAEEDFVAVLVEILQACTGEDSPARKKRRGWLAKRETPEVLFAMLQKKVYQVGSSFNGVVQELMAQTPALLAGGGQSSGCHPRAGGEPSVA
jgi:hypothetical protein